MNKLKDSIRSLEEFQALSPDRQARILSGSEVYVHGLRAAVRLMGWEIPDFDAVYGYLSCHSHYSPVSFMRTAEHGIDFSEPTDAQKALAGFALEVGYNALQSATSMTASLFQVANRQKQ